MKKVVVVFFAALAIIASCVNSENQREVKIIDYSNQHVLDSLIKATPDSNDTLFLGFVFGMSKTDYRSHIQKLRNDGLSLTFSKSNRVSNVAGTFELGSGYTFNTPISAKVSDKTITGQGQYLLEPIFNNEDKLIRLNVLAVENWSGGYLSNRPNWFQSRLKENSSPFRDANLKKAFVANEFIHSSSFIRKKGNFVIYTNSGVYSFVPLRYLFTEMLLKAIEKEIIEEKNQKITF